ncbi:unnamed protein product [Victoria cruziana]
MHGNYDGDASIDVKLTFDLYLGVDLWETIELGNTTAMYWTEFVGRANTTTIDVCLLKTTAAVPFISALELRPLTGHLLYDNFTASSSLTTFMRVNVGETAEVRYPADTYDRIWRPDGGSYGTPIRTEDKVKEDRSTFFGLPSAVMQTAANSSGPIVVAWPGGSDARYHLAMHFAELQQNVVKGKGQRNLTIKLNGDAWSDDFYPDYLDSQSIYTTKTLHDGSYSFSVEANNGSEFGPILNAFEVFKVVQPSGHATQAQDVDAINRIKDFYSIKRNWNGDPCLRQNYAWDGLTCSYENSSAARIIYLDLSNSGLQGPISDSISQLTALQRLNLSYNRLSGPVPSTLQRQANSGVLKLSTEGNPQICRQQPCEEGPKSGKQKRIIIAAAAAAALVALISFSGFIMIKRKRKPSDDVSIQPSKRVQGKGIIFSYAEISQMTDDFHKVIGKGGAGSVYYGRLKDGNEVAVKTLTRSLPQGIKQYTAEIELLMKVHHKYLASFVGFCDEDEKLILVYEYMGRGNLREMLSDETYTPDWKQRLQMALNVATALEYLHSGCRPPIVHRDVKTANILLDNNLEAKLADFGLSKTGVKDDITHMSTAIAGTPGYIDPEYYNTSKLTEKSDVYSFGVVLLELITGRHAIFTLGANRVHILQWVTPNIVRGKIDSIVDPRLQGSYDINSIWKVADTALSCSADKAIARPTMTEVVNELMEALSIETRVKRSSSIGTMPGSVSSSGGADQNLDLITYPSAR